MREARYVSLIPRTTLHSDSEQFIYNWKLENNPDLDQGKLEEAQRNVREENRNKSRVKVLMQTKVVLRRYANKSRVKVLTQNIIGRYLCPGSRAEIAEKATGGNKDKGKSRAKLLACRRHCTYATEIAWKQHAKLSRLRKPGNGKRTPGACKENRSRKTERKESARNGQRNWNKDTNSKGSTVRE
jgi:hypothetical protein